MPTCSVAGCKNSGVHAFPKDEKLRRKWELAVHQNFKAAYDAKLCTSHFKREDYIQGGYENITLVRKILKTGVIPSLFPCTDKKSTQITPMSSVISNKTETKDHTIDCSSVMTAQLKQGPEIGKLLNPDAPNTDFGTCRFCFTDGKHRNMMSEHVLDGKRENYSDMLLECFNVFISTDECSLICSSCAARLRDARGFRRMVIQAQQGLRHALRSVQAEVSVSVTADEVDIKPGPEEPKVPKRLEEPKAPEEPKESDVMTEPDDIKFEPDIDIEEHGVSQPNFNNGCRRKRNDSSGDDMDDYADDDNLDPKRQRLEEYIKSRLDSVLADIKPEIHTDQNNVYACNPESVEKFLEEYYNGKDDSEEDIEESTSDCPDNTLLHSNDRFKIDLDEENAFLINGCGCRQQCLSKFNRNLVLKSRLDCLELDFYCNHHINHLNVTILGALSVIANNTDISNDSKFRQRNHVTFLFRGMPVCRKFFLFAHGLGVKKFKNILKCFKENGVEAKTHGGTKSQLTVKQKDDVVKFINNFSKQTSLVLPGRSDAQKTDLHILPCSMNRSSVYEKYVEASKKDKKQPVSRAQWNKCWDTFCPHITVQTAISDPCRTCSDLINKLAKSQSEETKAKLSIQALDHFNHAQVQRAYYQNIIAQVSNQIMMDDVSLGHHAPCTYDGLVHYSFDYLQQIHLPHNHETSSLNFLDAFKVSLFGIAIEPLQKFVLYVIPETCIYEGVDVVISLLHHFFDTFALGETHVVCHADNCTNQSKNNLLIQYAIWRVMSGLHQSFQLSYLPSGHQKFAPDLYFGLFKTKFRESNANCLLDLCQIAASADSSDSMIGVIVGDEKGDVVNVNTYDWKKFFSDHNPRPIPELPYVHFKTDTRDSGSIKCSMTSPNDFSDVVKVFDSPFDANMPDIIQPQGLSLERQIYLYENVRSFVSPECQDILCPPPADTSKQQVCIVDIKLEKDDLDMFGSPEMEHSLDPLDLLHGGKIEQACNRVESPKVPPPRKTPICSYCGLFGHRNQMRQGRYYCKKRQLDSESKK